MSFKLVSFLHIYQVNTYYGKYPVNTLPGIYQVFTWVFTWVFTSFASQFGIYLGIYPGKYLECIYLKVFSSPYSQICEISRNFEKIRTKMGNNPVGKKGKYPQGKYLGKYLFT